MDTLQQIALIRKRRGYENYPNGTGIPDVSLLEARIRVQAAVASGSVTWRLLSEAQHARILAQRDPKKLREELLEGAALFLAWAESLK